MPADACGHGPITDLPVQPLLQKYFGFLLTQITGLWSSSRPKRGAFRDRHEREAGCGGRGCAFDEQRSIRGRRGRVVLTPRCWRQVCAEVSARRRDNKPVTEESAKETVKTIARGMPDVSGVTVVTNACAYYQCARGCGRAERPAFPASLLGSPCALFYEGRNEQAKPRAKPAARSRSHVLFEIRTHISSSRRRPGSIRRGLAFLAMSARPCATISARGYESRPSPGRQQKLSPPPCRSGFRRGVRRSGAGPCWSRHARRSSRCRRRSPGLPRPCGGSSRPCRRA
jgi:hypothetical protein